MALFSHLLKEKKGKLQLDGNKKERQGWLDEIRSLRQQYKGELAQRRTIYQQRRDFMFGDQLKYTNVHNKTGIQKTGHVYPVFNYMAPVSEKLQVALTNHPPVINVVPNDQNDPVEVEKAQTEERFLQDVFYDAQFEESAYPRAVSNQSVLGNFCLKTFFDPVEEVFRITNIEKMENVIVEWDGDNVLDYHKVVIVNRLPTNSVNKMFGLKLEATAPTDESGATASGHEDPYNTKSGSRSSTGLNKQPSGKGRVPTTEVIECCDDRAYGVIVGNAVVMYWVHDFGFNLFDIGHNKANVGHSWSKSDIDDLMDVQIELNERSGDEADTIKAVANNKYVAKNMGAEFDEKKIKSGQTQVIFVDGENADFYQLQQGASIFPSETYLQRIMDHVYNLGVPRVSFATGSHNVSGKAMAIEFQSVQGKIDDKRKKWETPLRSVLGKIKLLTLANYPKSANFEFLKNKDGQYANRKIDFDWPEIEPISQSDRVVDVLNLFQSGLWPMKKSYEDLGEKDPGAVIDMMKEEWKDDELAAIRSKHYEMTKGLLDAQARVLEAQIQLKEMAQAGGLEEPGAEGEGEAVGGRGNAKTEPRLKAAQNTRRQMMPAGGGVGSIASRGGAVTKQIQEQAAAGG